MPRGMEIRRAQLIEMHATLVNIPQGADVLEFLNRAADETGYEPVVILSGIGEMEMATLRVPNDEALDELMDIEEAFGVQVVDNLETHPTLKNLPLVELREDVKPEDLPADFPQPQQRKRKPHWSSIQHFDKPLSVLYAHGGRSKQTSAFKYHFIMSGCASRAGGTSESFVGQILPGCVAKSPLQFVVGLSAAYTTTVQAWTVSIQPGFDVLDRLRAFVKGRQNLKDCFVFSASGGMVGNAKLKNTNAAGKEEFRTLEAEHGPYVVEGLTAIMNGDVDSLRVHAAIILNCAKPPCDSVGGELVEAVVSAEQSLDIYLGELVEEQDIIA